MRGERPRNAHNVVMPSRLIPYVPTASWLYSPALNLPLHIFEERYKEMTGKAMRENSAFGIVLAKEEGIVNAGCTVMVQKLMHTYPDGRMDHLTRGQSRFEIAELNDEQSYLQAEVEFFDDDDEIDPPQRNCATRALDEFQGSAGDWVARGNARLNLDDPQISFQLAQTLPDLDFLNALLRHRSETERLQALNQYLETYIPRQRAVERIKAVAPTNGFGGKPAGDLDEGDDSRQFLIRCERRQSRCVSPYLYMARRLGWVILAATFGFSRKAAAYLRRRRSSPTKPRSSGITCRRACRMCAQWKRSRRRSRRGRCASSIRT